MHLVRHASEGWADAMRAHTLAPPDAGFAGRLQSLAEAAATEQVAWEQAHRAGLLWRPVPGGESAEPPYELRPGTGRRGPEPLWARFDAAVSGLNNLEIVGVDADRELILVKGAIPGPRGGVVVLRDSVKTPMGGSR